MGAALVWTSGAGSRAATNESKGGVRDCILVFFISLARTSEFDPRI